MATFCSWKWKYRCLLKECQWVSHIPASLWSELLMTGFFRVSSCQRLESQGPYIFISNHQSFFVCIRKWKAQCRQLKQRPEWCFQLSIWSLLEVWRRWLSIFRLSQQDRRPIFLLLQAGWLRFTFVLEATRTFWGCFHNFFGVKQLCLGFPWGLFAWQQVSFRQLWETLQPVWVWAFWVRLISQLWTKLRLHLPRYINFWQLRIRFGPFQVRSFSHWDKLLWVFLFVFQSSSRLWTY